MAYLLPNLFHDFRVNKLRNFSAPTIQIPANVWDVEGLVDYMPDDAVEKFKKADTRISIVAIAHQCGKGEDAGD